MPGAWPQCPQGQLPPCAPLHRVPKAPPTPRPPPLRGQGDVAPVCSAPVPFGKSWQRNGYAACVSRAKEMRKPITTTNEDSPTFPDLPLCLSVCLRAALLCCSSAAMSVEDVILGLFIREWEKKREREDAPGEETSHFQRERKCGETVTEPGRGICGTVTPHVGSERRIITGWTSDSWIMWFSFLFFSFIIPSLLQSAQRIYARTTFQHWEPGWSCSHATPVPPDQFHGIRTNRLTDNKDS